MCRSLQQLIEQRRDAQLRRPFANIVQIDSPDEKLLDITALQLGIGFKRPERRAKSLNLVVREGLEPSTSAL
jgi:hypothetical protein